MGNRRKLSPGHWGKTESVLSHFTWLLNQDNEDKSEAGVAQSAQRIDHHYSWVNSVITEFTAQKSSFISSKWMLLFFLFAFHPAGSGRYGRRESVEWNLAAWPFHTVRWGPSLQILIKVHLSMEIGSNSPINTVSVFRSIDPQPSWTYWPVRCGQTQRTGGSLTWSLVGSFLMFDP